MVSINYKEIEQKLQKLKGNSNTEEIGYLITFCIWNKLEKARMNICANGKQQLKNFSINICLTYRKKCLYLGLHNLMDNVTMRGTKLFMVAASMTVLSILLMMRLN